MNNELTERDYRTQRLDLEIKENANNAAMRIWIAAFRSIQDPDVVRSLAKGLSLLVESGQNYQALDFLEGLYTLTDEVFPERIYEYARSYVTMRKFFTSFEAKTRDVLLALDLAEFEVIAEELEDE